jgi:hypothetical protein
LARRSFGITPSSVAGVNVHAATIMKRFKAKIAFRVLTVILVLLAGCSSPVTNHGDFKSARTMFDSKDVRSVWSPAFSSILEKPLELKALDLPTPVDPLSFSLGESCLYHYNKRDWEEIRDKPWKGVLVIEAFSYPGRRLLGKAVCDETRRMRFYGRREPVKSFVLRISVRTAFEPPKSLSIHYTVHLSDQKN